MPGIVLHHLLAARTLDVWRAPPFSLRDAPAVEAFFQGSLGPDMGYYVGGGLAISDVLHHAGSADLARAMLEGARTPLQKAYAWGWVTHLLADTAVHPLINRASAELIHGGTDRSLTAADDPAAHLRVEFGLDAYLQTRYPTPNRTRFRAPFSGLGVRFLARAYRRTYGHPISAAALLHAQLSAGKRAPLMLALTRLTAGMHRLVRRTRTPRVAVFHRTPEMDGSHEDRRLALIRGLLTAVPPTPWLVRGVRRVMADFGGTFLEHYGTGLRKMENYNLDTGAVSGG